MALLVDKKNVVQVLAKQRVISAIYQGGVLLWQAVRSCFGAGFWTKKKPWLRKEAWRENKRF